MVLPAALMGPVTRTREAAIGLCLSALHHGRAVVSAGGRFPVVAVRSSLAQEHGRWRLTTARERSSGRDARRSGLGPLRDRVCLAPQPELGDQGPVPLDVVVPEVVEQPPP